MSANALCGIDAKLSDTAHCFTPTELVAMTVLMVTSATSAFAIVAVSLLIVKNALHHHRLQDGKRVIQQPMDLYMLSLLFANLIHSLGSLLNAKWIRTGVSDVGVYCTVQGILNQIGPVAVALHTILIAVVTFVAVWWRRGASFGPQRTYLLRIAFTITLVLWLFVGALVAIPAVIYRNSADIYWAPEPFWCTISKNYELERLLVKYLWLWIAFVISVILYIPLAFWARGNITINDEVWWRFRVHRRMHDESQQDWHGRHLFFSMIAYPLSNAILIIPLSIVRWIQLTGPTRISASSLENIAVVIVFDLSGLTNVLLLLYIRPKLLLLEKEQVHCECCPNSAGHTPEQEDSD